MDEFQDSWIGFVSEGICSHQHLMGSAVDVSWELTFVVVGQSGFHCSCSFLFLSEEENFCVETGMFTVTLDQSECLKARTYI